MPEPEICISKKSTDRIWKYLEKEYKQRTEYIENIKQI